MSNKFIHSWLNPKLKAKTTKKYNNGVFAISDIKKGELCAIFGGHIITAKEEAKFPQKYSDTGIQISDQFVISSLKHKEPTDCFNHCCDPNLGIKGQIFLVAMRNIKKGEEATFDYAMCLSFNKKNIPYFYNKKCLCESSKCRGRITADDWKNKKLQKKYKGFFSEYMTEKLKKSKL
jgi:SET domain-containing protein